MCWVRKDENIKSKKKENRYKKVIGKEIKQMKKIDKEQKK